MHAKSYIILFCLVIVACGDETTSPSLPPGPCSARETHGTCPGKRTCLDGACVVPALVGEEKSPDALEHWLLLADYVEQNYGAFAAVPDIDWSKVRDETASRVSDAVTQVDAEWAMTLGLSTLRDAHVTGPFGALCDESEVGYLAYHGYEGLSNTGACVALAGSQLFVYWSDAGAPMGLHVGDEVVAIDGRDVSLLLEDVRGQPKCSQQDSRDARGRADAANWALLRDEADEVFTVRRVDGTVQDVPIVLTDVALCGGLQMMLFERDGLVTHRNGIVSGRLDSDVHVVQMRAFYDVSANDPAEVNDDFVADLQEAFADAEGAVGLILDLRGNGGGFASNIQAVLGWLFAESTPILQIQRKNGAGPNDFDPLATIVIRPSSDLQLAVPLVVLADPLALSAADYVLQGVHVTGRGILMGAEATGAFGMAASFSLAGNQIQGSINPMRINDLDGHVLQGVPTPIDVPMEWTPEDARLGVDTVFDAAQAHLLSHTN